MFDGEIDSPNRFDLFVLATEEALDGGLEAFAFLVDAVGLDEVMDLDEGHGVGLGFGGGGVGRDEPPSGEDEEELADDHTGESLEDGVVEAVAMETDTELIGTEPGPAGDDVTADGEEGEAAVGDHFVPAGVEEDGIPENDHEGSIFFGVPTPEAAPAIVTPETAEDGTDEAEEEGGANETVGEGVEDLDEGGSGGFHRSDMDSDPHDEVGDAHGPGGEGCAVTEGDAGNVGGEPELRIENGLEDRHGIGGIEGVGHHEATKASDGAGDDAETERGESFHDEAGEDDEPTDEDGGGVEVDDGWALGDVDSADDGQGVDEENAEAHPEGCAADVSGLESDIDRRDDTDQNVEERGEVDGPELVVPGFEASAA